MSILESFVWASLQTFVTYSELSVGLKSRQNQPHCWCRQSTLPCLLSSPPGSPRREHLSLLATEFFLKVAGDGCLWTSILWVWGSLEDKRYFRNDTQLWFVCELTSSIKKSNNKLLFICLHLTWWLILVKNLTLYFELHLSNRWTWTDMNIMKLLNHLW